MTFASVVSTLIYVFSDELCMIFSSGEEHGINVSMAGAAIPIFAVTNLVDMCLSFFQGLVRALGI